MIPVYIFTGFLEAGKTSFLVRLRNERVDHPRKILLVQFENGSIHAGANSGTFQVMNLPIRLADEPVQAAKCIASTIDGFMPSEIWIEWNGMVSFTQLENILNEQLLRKTCRIRQSTHIADANRIEQLLGRTGPALTEQICQSDLILVRNAEANKTYRRIRKHLLRLNPGVNVRRDDSMATASRLIALDRMSPLSIHIQILFSFTLLFLLCQPLFGYLNLPVQHFVTVFLGVFLQAIPFLLIGILLSSAISLFLPQGFFERHFPKSLLPGLLIAVISGFFLPVCDCASIPIFRSLVRRGVPLPAAITFMLVTPIINPVALASTYVAFGGDTTVLLERAGLGIACAILVGLSFSIVRPKTIFALSQSASGNGCSCGCEFDSGSKAGLVTKLRRYLYHVQNEFFRVVFFLFLGSMTAALFQMLDVKSFFMQQSGSGLVLSVLAMMAMAFLLSLCSSSDAMIARGLSAEFSRNAVLGFLVFGPMMDLKNVMLLSTSFSRRFIWRLLLTTAIVCAASVLIYASVRRWM